MPEEVKSDKYPKIIKSKALMIVGDNSADKFPPAKEPPDTAEADILPDTATPETEENGAKQLTNEEVTGYTAGLWKYIPVPENEPDPVPEYITKTEQLAGGEITAARVRGKKHKHDGSYCDDWFETADYRDMIFTAVSDGAGSKKFSRVGAREACKAAVGYLVSSFKNAFEEDPSLSENIKLELSDEECMKACGVLANIVQQSVIKAYEAVEAAFYSRMTDKKYSDILGRDIQLKDFSATLLITVIIPIGASEEKLVISCQVGDGMIALLNSKGVFENSLKLMGKPDSGDFSGETDFLTSPQMTDIQSLQARTKISRSVFDTVFVMTDGVADDYFPNETGIRRLYYDLIINGVIKTASGRQMKLTPQNIGILKKIPDPLVYPWVNDKNIRTAVQYTNRICASLGISLEDIWNDLSILELAKLEMPSDENTDAGEKLKIWLDNYVERGSFDDRTLVIIRI